MELLANYSAYVAIGSSIELPLPEGYGVRNYVWFKGGEPTQHGPAYQIFCVGESSFAKYTLLFTDEKGRQYCKEYELFPLPKDVLGRPVRVPLFTASYASPHDAFFVAYRVYKLNTAG